MADPIRSGSAFLVVHISADDAHADDAAAALGFAALATNRLFAPDALLPPGRARRAPAKRPTGTEPLMRAGSGSSSARGSPTKRKQTRTDGDAAAADARAPVSATAAATAIAAAPPAASVVATKVGGTLVERPRVSAMKGQRKRRGEAGGTAPASHELRERLRTFYERCSPDKLGNIDLIIDR